MSGDGPGGPSEDEVSEANEGPVGTEAATAPAPEATPQAQETAEWDAAMAAVLTTSEPEGKPKEAEAVDKSEVKDTTSEETKEPKPEVKAETPETKDEATPDSTESTTETKPEINFDGFSDSQKATWERLHKEGHATPEEIEENRLNTMFHAAFTKKTMALAEERKKFNDEREGWGQDYEKLKIIRDNEALHDKWMKFQVGEHSGDSDIADDDLVDRKAAEQIAVEKFKQLQIEAEARTAEQQKVYEAKSRAIGEALGESLKILGLDLEKARPYLSVIEGSVPADADFVDHINPATLHDKIASLHETAKLKARIAELETKQAQEVLKDARTTKQSLPPAPRVAASGKLTPLQQTELDLGLDPEWASQISGGGFPNR